MVQRFALQSQCHRGRDPESVWMANNNNNNEYLERLTRTGPKRLHVLYKYILSKFNAYNMNAHTHARTHTDSHTHARTRAHAHAHTHTHTHTHTRTHTQSGTYLSDSSGAVCQPHVSCELLQNTHQQLKHSTISPTDHSTPQYNFWY